MADLVKFNCGKMNSILVPGKGKYEGKDMFTSEIAQRALLTGTAYLKVHGECSMLVKQDDQWMFYMRRDNYKGDDDQIGIPDGVQPASYGKHNYSLVLLDPKSKFGVETYQAIEHGVRRELIPDPTLSDSPDYLSVEWVGKKHQGNVDGVPVDHGLVVHSSCIFEDPPRDIDTLYQMATEVAIEGLIYQDPETGERFKFRFDMCPDSKFKKLKRNSDITDIRPTVITAKSVIFFV